MRFLKWVIRPYLYIRYHFERLTKTGSFGADPAVRVIEPYTPTGNRLKDRLHQFHVKQFHESSCSVASVASVINALINYQGDRAGTFGDPPITQQDLLEQVKTAHWKERMSANGYKGRRGLPLAVLGQVVTSSLDAYDIHYKMVEIVQATRDPKRQDTCRQVLLTRLLQFEKQGDCLIIAHFDQGSFLPELHIPHISPIGGFDPVNSTVKILDVDSTQTFFYQISFDRFYKGISTDYNTIFRHYGYAEGGYVFILL
ncbi:MAG: phytochelatin synthase family protein [Pseudomonadota bacterium]